MLDGNSSHRSSPGSGHLRLRVARGALYTNDCAGAERFCGLEGRVMKFTQQVIRGSIITRQQLSSRTRCGAAVTLRSYGTFGLYLIVNKVPDQQRSISCRTASGMTPVTYASSVYKSRQSGLCSLIRLIFQPRRHFLIRFSEAMASATSAKPSHQTSRLT